MSEVVVSEVVVNEVTTVEISSEASLVEVAVVSQTLEVGQANFPSASGEAEMPASNQWGEAVGVVAGATATLASIPSSVEGYRVKGFTANGVGDGYFFIQVASLTVLSGRIRSTAPVYVILLPNGMLVAPGSTVTLKVTNESGSTANFEATLLGI